MCSVIMTGCFSYSKVVIATILQQKGRPALLWCGACTQTGACVGSVTAFILINVLKIFYQIPTCPLN